LAIRTLGNAIDASLVDLKGGTTGQVLAKASNTDMDFTWAADAGAPTSLGYAAGKNKIINGDFGIWQRGTSFTPAAGTAGYVADRYNYYRDGSGSTATISQQTFTAGTAPVAGYEGQYFLRFNQTVAGSGATENLIQQYIEDVRTFAGQTITVSFWAKADSSRTVQSQMQQFFGAGGSTRVDQTAVSHSVTTSWQRFTTNFTMPSIAGKTEEQVTLAAKLFLNKFQQVKTNKPVIGKLKEQLAIYINNTPNAESFMDCFKFLDGKADDLLAADETALLDNL
jgi:hypothetical protein